MVQLCRTPQTAQCCWLKRWPLSACRSCSLSHTPEGRNLDQSPFGTGHQGRTQTHRWMCRSLSPTLWHSSCVLWSSVTHFPVWGTCSRTALPAGASWWSDLCCCQTWWFHSWKLGFHHLPGELKVINLVFKQRTKTESNPVCNEINDVTSIWVPQALRGTTAMMWVLLECLWRLQAVLLGSLSRRWSSWSPENEDFSTSTLIVDSLQITWAFTGMRKTYIFLNHKGKINTHYDWKCNIFTWIWPYGQYLALETFSR